jgi:hypothetical protein
MLFVQYPENRCSSELPLASGLFQLVDNPSLFESVSELLEPKTPSFEITETCFGNERLVKLSCNDFPKGCSKRRGKKIKISVTNVDCSSDYSIHVKYPNGGWAPYVRGLEYELTINETGIYTIYIRQDNMGLPSESFGTETIYREIYLEKWCCEDLSFDECNIVYFSPENSEESFQQDEITNRVSIGNEISVRLYPNPVENKLYLKYFGDNISEIKIYSLTGELMRSFHFNKDRKGEIELGVEFLPVGLYFLSITFLNGHTTHHKFVKD